MTDTREPMTMHPNDEKFLRRHAEAAAFSHERRLFAEIDALRIDNARLAARGEADTRRPTLINYTQARILTERLSEYLLSAEPGRDLFEIEAAASSPSPAAETGE